MTAMRGERLARPPRIGPSPVVKAPAGFRPKPVARARATIAPLEAMDVTPIVLPPANQPSFSAIAKGEAAEWITGPHQATFATVSARAGAAASKTPRRSPEITARDPFGLSNHMNRLTHGAAPHVLARLDPAIWSGTVPR